MNDAILTATGVTKNYFDGPRILHVLKGISLTVSRGDCLAIVGPSGAGKSTLLHILGALDRPTEGEVILHESSYNELSPTELSRIRAKNIGFVFQFHHLLPEFSALENVMIPCLIAGDSKPDARAKASELLDEVGLADRLSHRPSKLSGGEQQRVALARALVNEPDIVLADEPTGNLDSETSADMIELIWGYTVRKGKALLIVTHDNDIAQQADRIIHIKDGMLTR